MVRPRSRCRPGWPAESPHALPRRPGVDGRTCLQRRCSRYLEQLCACGSMVTAAIGSSGSPSHERRKSRWTDWLGRAVTRVALVDDECFLDHWAVSHVERPERLRAVSAAIAGAADLARLVRIRPARADDSVLLRVHSAAHISAVEAMSQSGGGWFGFDTYCTDRSAGTARLAAGSAVAVCDAVLAGDVRHGVALIRPPGHHAGRDTAMGFCLYNNAAVVVRHAQESGAPRVAVIDIDVHHRNGTEEIVRNDRHSVHLHPPDAAIPWDGPERGSRRPRQRR